jgi:hypothetical protein
VGGGCVLAAATTRTTWWCCTGGGWASATPMPMAPMQWWGVVIDKLIPSLIYCWHIYFTSTRSKHSDSPWCEPITPQSEAKKYAWGQTIILGGEDRRKVQRKTKIGYY